MRIPPVQPLRACLGLLLAVLAAALVPTLAPAPAVAAGDVRVATEDEHAELVPTLPIGRQAGSERRVVMSIGPDKLGALMDGDRLEATAEFEVTVCLKPDPDHPGDGYPCIGEMYGYDPHIDARLVLGRSADAKAPAATALVADRKVITCKQSQPNRNHHCVIAIPDGRLDVNDASALPCPPSECHLNLVASAWHPASDAGEKVVVGSHTRDGEIQQNRGRVDALRFRPGTMGKPAPRVTRTRRTRSLPIAPKGAEPARRVVYSVALPGLTQGEILAVDGKALASLGGVPYNVFAPAEIVLAESPGATNDSRLTCQLTGCDAEVGRTNGVNCTQGPSAHPNPCARRKLGTVRIEQSTDRTLYMNLVVGIAAMPNANQRHDSGDRLRVRRGGFLRVFRFGRDLEPCDGERPTIAGAGSISGGPNSDVILGSASRDVIHAGQGNDVICAGGGNDLIYGESDNDRILAGAGDDEAFGGIGTDRLWGGEDADTLSGDSGDDFLFGELGNDRLLGGGGRDALDGGPESDRCSGEGDSDSAQACELTDSI